MLLDSFNLIIIILLFVTINIYLAVVFRKICAKLGYNFSKTIWIPFSYLFILPIICKKNWKQGLILILPMFLGLIISFYSITSFNSINWIFIGLFIIVTTITMIFFYIILFKLLVILFEMFNYPKKLSFIIFGFIHPYISFLSIIAILIVLGHIAWSKQRGQTNFNSETQNNMAKIDIKKSRIDIWLSKISRFKFYGFLLIFFIGGSWFLLTPIQKSLNDCRGMGCIGGIFYIFLILYIFIPVLTVLNIILIRKYEKVISGNLNNKYFTFYLILLIFGIIFIIIYPWTIGIYY